jgi:lactoylglutathione lyase
MRVACLLLGVLVAQPLFAQAEGQRPRVLGLSHIALYVSDLKIARLFYEESLGFHESYTLRRLDGTERIVNLKVNDEQFLELFAEPASGDGRMSHFALYTDDARSLAQRLATRGVRIIDSVHKGQTGNEFFSLRDPDGHLVEIVEYKPDGLTLQDRGRFLSPSRVSNHILQVGIRVGSLALSLRFYRDILGFQEVSRTAPSGTQPGSVVLRVPDGEDQIRLLLYREYPAPYQRIVENYVCLARSSLSTRTPDSPIRPQHKVPAMPTSNAAEAGLDLYDPDGMHIRLEISSSLKQKLTSSPPGD